MYNENSLLNKENLENLNEQNGNSEYNRNQNLEEVQRSKKIHNHATTERFETILIG